MAQVRADPRSWSAIPSLSPSLAKGNAGAPLGQKPGSLRVRLINAIESRASGITEGDAAFINGTDDSAAKRRRLVGFQEEQLGFLDLPLIAHWVGGKPTLQELKSRMATSLQLQEQACTSPSFVVQYSTSAGVLTPLHTDLELQGLLSSWLDQPLGPGDESACKLYVSLTSGPTTRPSHAPETPVLSPAGLKATSRTYTDFSATSTEGASLTHRMSSILLPSFSLDLDVLAKSNSLVEPNPSMISHVLDTSMWAPGAPCGQTLVEIHTGETTHPSPRHHPFGNLQAPSPPPPASLQDNLAGGGGLGDLLLAPIRTAANAVAPPPQPHSATAQNYPSLNASRGLSPLGPPNTVDSGYGGPPKSHSMHTSHLKVPIVTTGGPPAATPTNRTPETPGVADSSATAFLLGSNGQSNSPAKSLGTPRRGARRVGPNSAQPSGSLAGAPSEMTDDTNAQEPGSEDDGTQVGSKKRPGPSKGRGSRPSKGRETDTKFADGRKKCDAAHQNSMNGMIEACRNMFGPLSHMVEVVDYKHIRCLACEPHQDVKAYSAYHTACIRKHYLRHHAAMLFESHVDLTHFREYKVSAKGVGNLMSTPSGAGLTTAGSTGTSSGMDLKRGRLSSLVSDPDPGSPRSSRRRTAVNTASPSGSGFTQQQHSTPTSATPRSNQFMPTSPQIKHVLTHNPASDAVNHMGSPFNPGAAYNTPPMGSPLRSPDALSVPWNQANLKPPQVGTSMSRPWTPSNLHVSSGGGAGLPMMQPQLQGNGIGSGASSPMRQMPSTAASLAASQGVAGRMGSSAGMPPLLSGRTGAGSLGWDLPNLPNLSSLDAHLANLSGSSLGALLDPMPNQHMNASRQVCQVPPPSRHNLGRSLLDIPRSPAGMHSPGRINSPRGTSQGGLLPVAPLMSSPAHTGGGGASNLGRLAHNGLMGPAGVPDSPPHNTLGDSMDPQFMSEFLSSLKSISNVTSQLSAQLAADQANRVKTPGLDPSSRRGTQGGDPYSNAANSPRPMNMHLDNVGNPTGYPDQASPRPMIPQLPPAYNSPSMYQHDHSLLGGSSFMHSNLGPNKDVHAAHNSWANLNEPTGLPQPVGSPMMHNQLLSGPDPLAGLSRPPLPPLGDLPAMCALPEERASHPGLPTVNSDDDDLPGFGFCSDKLMGYSLTQLLRQEQDELDAAH